MWRASRGSNASPQASGFVHTTRQIESWPSHSSSAVVPSRGASVVWKRAPVIERSDSEPARSPKQVRKRAGQLTVVRGAALRSMGWDETARPKVMLLD